MPWNDPHTAAPSLWAWQNAEGFSFECSAAPFDTSQGVRRGMESFLLYRYRQERGESTLCNFGRFHPKYRKSTNRKENIRGGMLDETNKDNPVGGSSIPPLPIMGTPQDQIWMGLSWSGKKPLDGRTIGTIPPSAGLYILFEEGNEDLIYIGQSKNCAKRLISHTMRFQDLTDILFSYYIAEKPLLQHNLKELENDLIGNYFEVYRKAPKYQFGQQTVAK
jgi:hypothetical protein